MNTASMITKYYKMKTVEIHPEGEAVLHIGTKGTHNAGLQRLDLSSGISTMFERVSSSFSLEVTPEDRHSMDVVFDSPPIKLEPSSPALLTNCGNLMMNGNSGGVLSDLTTSEDEFSPERTYQYENGDLSSTTPSPVNGISVDFCTSTIPSDQDSSDILPKRICLVCGDIASGYHYGVASCEACKAFFKRTVQGHIEYQCPASGDCEITKRRRKACQACRFQKCLQMGMLKEGVRLDRVRGGRQKYRRCDPTTIMMHQNQAKKPCFEFKGENKMLTELLRIEPEKVYAMPDPTQTIGELKFMSTLSDLADRELVVTIGWAKQVPGFANLSLSDQMNLLQAAWCDTLMLNLAYRSTPYKGYLVFADDFQISEEDAEKYVCPQDLDKVNRKMAKKMTSLGITKDEYVLLKAMVLFNEDANVDNAPAVKQVQDKYHDALIEYVQRRSGGSVRRVGNLLMLLPLMTQAKILAKQYWFNIKQEGKVPMHKLFLEMLEANS
ncbi:unnamed protein product [Owenia fusiformis]|uniref:Uncharacterized protein n=1 Tax=Owenia fusiformis TaxID=6347 RepID=A0A8J1U5M4_OWEFU|nr:unnamed protein product [Owenia fusiformis]